jgi:hypothetical protein
VQAHDPDGRERAFTCWPPSPDPGAGHAPAVRAPAAGRPAGRRA